MFRQYYSSNSLKALDQLQKYEDSLTEIENSLIYIENNITKNNYTLLIDKLSQLNGDIDKIQFNGIDSIITIQLISGKQKIKNTKKYLNLKCGIMIQKIIDLDLILKQYKKNDYVSI